MRDMMVEIRIVEADANGGAGRRCARRGLSSARTVPDWRYQLEHDFREQGDYVAFVRARSEDGRKEYNARFVFSVGEAFLRDWTAVAVATVVVFVWARVGMRTSSASDRRTDHAPPRVMATRSLPWSAQSSRWIVIASATKQSTF